MPNPALPPELLSQLNALALSVGCSDPVDVEELYVSLTTLGWKIDTEESNLMRALSKTWREAGIKVWLSLKRFVCAPPMGEQETIDDLRFYRFSPDEMPSGTMYDAMYSPGDEEEDWYAAHREDWDWLVEHGDPQFDTFDLLTPTPPSAVPSEILVEAWAELQEAVSRARH